MCTVYGIVDEKEGAKYTLWDSSKSLGEHVGFYVRFLLVALYGVCVCVSDIKV